MHITTPHSGSYSGNYRSHFADDSVNRQHARASTTTALNISGSTAAPTIAPVDAATAVAKPAFDADTISKNILSFIEQRLSKAAGQGASQDQLADLLTQARQGVTNGFGQAVDQLKGVGAFDDALSSGISSALQKVDSGLDDLAKQLGLPTSAAAPTTANTATNSAPTTTPTVTTATTPATTPATTSATTTPATTASATAPAPAPSTTTATPNTTVNTSTNTTPAPQTGTLTQLAAAYRASFSSRQSVDLVVKTADGDTVHLQLDLRDKQTISAAYQSNANGQQLTLSSSQKSSAGLSISVDGNLDAGELTALGDLLDQLGKVTDSFFSGDVAGAVQKAGTLDFSNPELDSFSLDLHSTITTKAKVAAYAAVQSLGNDAAGASASIPTAGSTAAASSAPAPTSSTLSDLFKALSSLAPKAAVANNPASLLKQLLAAQIGAANQQNNPLLSFVDRLLTALGADADTAATPGSTTSAATTAAAATPSTTATSTTATSTAATSTTAASTAATA